MDLLCLLITGALLHQPVRRLRALLGAGVGGLYAVLSLLLLPGGAIGLVLDIAAALLICTAAFWSRGLSLRRVICRCTPVQFLTSMMLGGVMTALYSLLNRLHLPFEALQGDGLSVWTFALLTAVASIATLRGGRFFGLSHKTKQVTVHAVLFGRSVTLSAMVDSGNLLCDPISGKSVIVAELSRLSAVLPPDLLRAYQTHDVDRLLTNRNYAGRIRPIPARTAGGEALLFALVPNELTLTVGRETYPADHLIAPAELGESARGFDAVIAPV